LACGAIGWLSLVSPVDRITFRSSITRPLPLVECGEGWCSSTGRWELKQTTDTIHASALDQNRGVGHPGSPRSKSSIARDAQGNVIERTVTSWTSYGVPHSVIAEGDVKALGISSLRRSEGQGDPTMPTESETPPPAAKKRPPNRRRFEPPSTVQNACRFMCGLATRH
jgi:hypothetical protein